MSKKTEIQALIKLLEDDDILANISQKLLSYGNEVIGPLEIAWENSTNPKLHTRIENIIEEIKFVNIHKELKEWISDPFNELLDGILIISKFQYSDLDLDKIKNKIDTIKQKIWIELNNYLTPLEKVNIFNHVFYKTLGFKGNHKAKPEISDYYINEVLETKKGNSISLGILYIILANKLNLKVYGVALPKHFILCFQNNFIVNFSIDNSADVIFYMDPKASGAIFERNKITEYIKMAKIEKKKSNYSPVDDIDVIQEYLIYLKDFYSKYNTKKLVYIEKLLELF